MSASESSKKKWWGLAKLAVIVLALIAGYLWFGDSIEKDYRPDVRNFLGALVASLLFLIVYQIFADEAVIKSVSNETANAAVEHVLQRLELVPTRVFSESDQPDPSFEQLFHDQLKISDRYWFKGSTGRKIAERLSQSEPETFRNKEVRVLLLDPSDESLLTATAKSNLGAPNSANYDASQIQAEKEKVKTQIYESVAQMFKVHRRNNIDLRFHKEYVFYRTEIFQNGLLLSYSDGGKSFPGSALYESGSKVYRAYERNFRHHFDRANESVFPKDDKSDPTLKQLLTDLGCTGKLAQELEDKHGKKASTSLMPNGIAVNPVISELLACESDVTGQKTCEALKKTSEPNRLTKCFEELAGNREYLEWIAARSYRHSNGFDKIVLGESPSGAKVRLHMWWKDSGTRSDVHDHYWDFSSVILYGTLTSELYAKTGTGKQVKAYHFHLFPRSNGDFALRPLGEITLVRVEQKTLTKGEIQSLDHAALHTVNCPAHGIAATLVLHSRKLWNENNVFDIDGSGKHDEEVEVTHFTSEEVREKLIFAVQQIKGVPDKVVASIGA